MKTDKLLTYGALGVGAYLLFKHFESTSAPATGTSRYVSRYVGGLGRRPHDFNTMQNPWGMNQIQYGQGGGQWMPWGWQPYSPSAAFGPSPVEMESPGSISFMASQIDAGMY